MTEGFQNTNNQLQEIMRRLDSAQPSSEKLQADIDEAVSDCNSGDYGGGRKLFQRLRDRHWESLSAAQQFRVLFNLAVITEQVAADFTAAGDLFILAADTVPEHAEAEAARALGLLHKGQVTDARVFAGKAILKSPTNETACAAWLHTSDENETLADIVTAVPRDQQSKPNTAYNLGVVAQTREEFDIAIQFHRVAIAGNGHTLANLQLGLSLIRRLG